MAALGFDDLTDDQTLSEDQATDAVMNLAPGAQITSGYRTPEHNAAVNGVPNSLHTRGGGQAQDIVLPANVTPEDFRGRLTRAGYPVSEYLVENKGDPHSTGYHVHWGWGPKGNAAPAPAQAPAPSSGPLSFDDIVSTPAPQAAPSAPAAPQPSIGETILSSVIKPWTDLYTQGAVPASTEAYKTLQQDWNANPETMGIGPGFNELALAGKTAWDVANYLPAPIFGAAGQAAAQVVPAKYPETREAVRAGAQGAIMPLMGGEHPEAAPVIPKTLQYSPVETLTDIAQGKPPAPPEGPAAAPPARATPPVPPQGYEPPTQEAEAMNREFPKVAPKAAPPQSAPLTFDDIAPEESPWQPPSDKSGDELFEEGLNELGLPYRKFGSVGQSQKYEVYTPTGDMDEYDNPVPQTRKFVINKDPDHPSWHTAIDSLQEFKPPEPPPVPEPKPVPKVVANAPPKRPPDLLQFIADRGGLSADQSAYGQGNLQAMEAQKWHVGKPFQKRLVQPPGAGGMTLHQAREAAIEAGFGHEPMYNGLEGEDDLLNAIGDAVGGKEIFPEGDRGGYEDAQAWREFRNLKFGPGEDYYAPPDDNFAPTDAGADKFEHDADLHLAFTDPYAWGQLHKEDAHVASGEVGTEPQETEGVHGGGEHAGYAAGREGAVEETGEGPVEGGTGEAQGRPSVTRFQKDKEDLFATEPGAVDARGKALPQTIIPGAEKSAIQLAKAREAQGHGLKATKAAQKEAGPLFGPGEGAGGGKQGSLFQKGEGKPTAAGERVKLADDLIGHTVGETSPEEAKLINAVEAEAAKIIPSAKVGAYRKLLSGGDFAKQAGHGVGARVTGASYADGLKGLIAWSLESPDAIGTLRHEALHYLYGRGVISPKEWSALEDGARKGDWQKKYDIANRYPDASESIRTEEAIAEHINQWRKAPASVPKMFAPLVTRVSRFMAHIADHARRIMGKDVTADDVLSRLYTGELGKRAELTEGRQEPSFQKDEPAFRRWFGKSKVVDEDGNPQVVYHGTTADFTKFDPHNSNIESDWGKGFYFSSEPNDIENNYAGFGPDLTSKIELRSERLADQYDYDAEVKQKLDSFAKQHGIDPENVQDVAKAYVRSQLASHEGATLPVHLKLTNPFEVGGEHETYLDYHERYNEKTDEYGEPRGKLVKFIEALRKSAEHYNVDASSAVDSIFERGVDGGLRASELEDILRKDEAIQYAEDPNTGDLAGHELIRDAVERAGFDGVIDNRVYQKFGDERSVGKPMGGIYQSTKHYVAFKPTQIKSAIGNRGTFGRNNPDIRFQKGVAEQGRDPEDAVTDAMAADARAKGPGTYARFAANKLNDQWAEGKTKHVNGVEAQTILPQTLAGMDWRSAKYYGAVKARDAFVAAAKTTWAEMLKPFTKLSHASQDKVLAGLELLRLDNRNVADDGNPLELENTNHGLAEMSKPGDVLRFTPAEKSALFAVKGMFAKQWRDLMKATAVKFGWHGDPSPEAIRAFADQSQQGPAGKRALGRIADIMQAMAESERQGYVPLMRHGDYYLAVKRKPQPGDDSLGGFPPVDWFRRVQSKGTLENIFGRPSFMGEKGVPGPAFDAVEDLNKNGTLGHFEFDPKTKTWASDTHEIEHGYLSKSPDALRSLSVPAIEKLMYALEHRSETGERAFSKNPAFKAMMDEVRTQMYEDLKAGFKKKAKNVPGYDPDFRRSISNYSNWLGEHTGDLTYGDTIERGQNTLENHPDPNVQKFWKTWDAAQDARSTLSSRLWQKLGNLAFYYAIGGVPASAASVFLHGPTVGTAALASGTDVGTAIGAMTRSLARTTALGMKVGVDGLEAGDAARVGKSPAEKAFLRQREKEGAFHSGMMADMGALKAPDGLSGKAKSGFKHALNAIGSTIGGVDALNRLAITHAAYEMASDPKTFAKIMKQWGTNESFKDFVRRYGKTPEAVARFALADAAFDYGKRNTPGLARSTLGKLYFQFHNFVYRAMSKQAELLYRRGPAGRKALAMMLVGIGALAGAQGEDFAVDAEKLYDFLRSKYGKPGSDVAADMEKWVAQRIGPTGAKAVMHGPIATALGVNLTSRLGFGDVISREFQNVPVTANGLELPLPPGVAVPLKAGIHAYQRYKSGQGAVAAGAELLPNFAKRPVQAAAVWPQHGVQPYDTHPHKGTYGIAHAKPLIPAGQVSPADQIRYGLGYEPERLEEAYDQRNADYLKRHAHGKRGLYP